MTEAKISIVNKEVLNKCKARNIEVYTLENSKAYTIAFSSNNRRRREFEITFLKDAEYRVSTRFQGYKTIMEKSDGNCFVDHDPDERRIRANVNLDTMGAVNRLVSDMLEYGFSGIPVVMRR